MKGPITLLLLLLLVSFAPAHATNNALPQGASVELDFSPHRIPLGASSTLAITVGAQNTGTDLYILVDINFQDWLRWQTSDIRMGNFLYGGVVFKPDNQNLNSDFLQIAVVVPKGDYITVMVPVTPTRAGVFVLHEIEVITLPVVNGNFVPSPDSPFPQGLAISFLQFNAVLTVYDPELRQISDNQRQILDNQNQAFNLLQDGLHTLETGVQNGFNGISNQTAVLASQQGVEFRLIESQFRHMTNAFYILLGMSVLILLYLFWFTYRVRPKPS